MSVLRSRSRDALHSLHKVNNFLFHWNFYRIHLTYFFLVIILASVVLYGSNTSFRLSYADAIFLCASAMTNTGLNSVNLSALTAWQQVILFILMLMGDLTLVTVVVVYIRKHYFKKRLQELVEHNKVAQPMALKRHDKTANRVGRTEECAQSTYRHPRSDGDGSCKSYGSRHQIKLEARMSEVMEPSPPRGRCTYLDASPIFPFGVYRDHQ